MRYRSIAAVCGMGLAVSACVSPPSPLNGDNHRPSQTEISAPPLDVVSIARVGDKMLEQGFLVEQDAIHLSAPVTVGTLGTYTFSPGNYAKRGQNSDGEFFGPGGIPDSGTVQAGALTDPFQTMLLEPDGSLCGVSVFNMKVCLTGVEVKRVKVPDAAANSFQQTLIYNGKVGEKINIGYREFSGDMARPAFNNEVEYDLKESSTIGYKSAVIEVVEATNQQIKYIVHKNFNDAAR